jgi:hypothetical protein
MCIRDSPKPQTPNPKPQKYLIIIATNKRGFLDPIYKSNPHFYIIKPKSTNPF